jgi:primosomal replication protein N
MNATLIERSAVRYTPAGVPVVEAQLQHRSRVVEEGVDRLLDFALGAVAIGEPARRLAQMDLGGHLQLDGFLAPRSLRSARLTVHILEFTRCAAGDEAPAPRND